MKPTRGLEGPYRRRHIASGLPGIDTMGVCAQFRALSFLDNLRMARDDPTAMRGSVAPSPVAQSEEGWTSWREAGKVMPLISEVISSCASLLSFSRVAPHAGPWASAAYGYATFHSQAVDDIVKPQ